MKLRSKLLLSATCLLTISVAATATSAYAWFVSNRQATVAINNATVKTNATNLKIAGVTKGAGDTATLTAVQDNTNGVNASASTIKATDISGDGVNFYKPKLAPDFTTSHKATSITKVENGASTYYHQFKLTFSQDNADVNTGVFLSSDSSVLLNTTETTKNVGISLCTRVAFLKETNDVAKPYELLLYWAPNRTAEVANKSYIKTAYSETTPVSIEDTETTTSVLQSVSAEGSTIKGKSIYGTPTDVNDATDKKDEKVEHLLTLVGATPQTIIVRIWFEGMDDACNKDNLSDTIDANLKFNGVNMNI